MAFSRLGGRRVRNLTARRLRRLYFPLYPGVHIPRGIELSAVQRARAGWLWSRRDGVIAGLSASAMLGARWSPARTAFAIGRRLDLRAGVQRIDALMNATDIDVGYIESVAAQHPGTRPGTTRSTLEVVDGGAESPWESLTRLLFVTNGFPRPQTQIPVLDDYGVLVAVIDMGWCDYCVGVDFEGTHHWTTPRQRHWDIERFTRLPELGWQDFRVTSRMVRSGYRLLLDLVGAALIARGCPKTWRLCIF